MDELVPGDSPTTSGPRETLRHALTCLGVALGLAYTVLIGVPGMASASTWLVSLAGGSKGEARAQPAPSAPTGVSAACTSSSLTTVKVTWTAVTHATQYSVFKSTTSSSSGYSSAATGVVTTSWTSSSLANGNYWFEVAALIGSNWTSVNSSATAQRTITTGHCA